MKNIAVEATVPSNTKYSIPYFGYSRLHCEPLRYRGPTESVEAESN